MYVNFDNTCDILSLNDFNIFSSVLNLNSYSQFKVPQNYARSKVIRFALTKFFPDRLIIREFVSYLCAHLVTFTKYKHIQGKTFPHLLKVSLKFVNEFFIVVNYNILINEIYLVLLYEELFITFHRRASYYSNG